MNMRTWMTRRHLLAQLLSNKDQKWDWQLSDWAVAEMPGQATDERLETPQLQPCCLCWFRSCVALPVVGPFLSCALQDKLL